MLAEFTIEDLERLTTISLIADNARRFEAAINMCGYGVRTFPVMTARENQEWKILRLPNDLFITVKAKHPKEKPAVVYSFTTNSRSWKPGAPFLMDDVKDIKYDPHSRQLAIAGAKQVTIRKLIEESTRKFRWGDAVVLGVETADPIHEVVFFFGGRSIEVHRQNTKDIITIEKYQKIEGEDHWTFGSALSYAKGEESCCLVL